MSRISGFITVGEFVEQGKKDLPTAGNIGTFYGGNAANYAFCRVQKHASQTGGATPIAYLSYDPGNNTPDANSIPLYDGDTFEVWPEEIRSVSVASADANQPTLHYVLRMIG